MLWATMYVFVSKEEQVRSLQVLRWFAKLCNMNELADSPGFARVIDLKISLV